jgi:hypothetical protein
MTDQELALTYAIQRYIYDFMEDGGVVESDFENADGWVNLSLAKNLAKRIIKLEWIRDNE